MIKEYCKYLLLIAILLISLSSFSYTKSTDSTDRICENALFVKYSLINMVDPYLSPLKYYGSNIMIGSRWDKSLGRNNLFTQRGYIQLGYNHLYNTHSKNTVHGLNINAGWGFMYSFNLVHNTLIIGIGPFHNVDYLGKLMIKNVNKPYSMDIGIDVGNLLNVSYTILFKNEKHGLRLSYSVFNNLLGIAYSPYFWQSYYEITEGVRGKTTFTYPQNRLSVKHKLLIDIQINKFSGSIGVEHQFFRYNYTSLDHTMQTLSFILGYRLNYTIVHHHLSHAVR